MQCRVTVKFLDKLVKCFFWKQREEIEITQQAQQVPSLQPPAFSSATITVAAIVTSAPVASRYFLMAAPGCALSAIKFTLLRPAHRARKFLSKTPTLLYFSKFGSFFLPLPFLLLVGSSSAVTWYNQERILVTISFRFRNGSEILGKIFYRGEDKRPLPRDELRRKSGENSYARSAGGFFYPSIDGGLEI